MDSSEYSSLEQVDERDAILPVQFKRTFLGRGGTLLPARRPSLTYLGLGVMMEPYALDGV